MKNFQSRLQQALELKKARKLELAYDAFSALAADNPHSAFFWANFAHLCVLLDRASEAKHYAEIALGLNPHDSFTRRLYAEILLKLKEITPAIDLCIELMQEKFERNLLRQLMKSLFAEKKESLLEPYIPEWMQRYGDDPDFAILAAEYYNKTNRRTKAVEIYQRLLEKNPGNDFIFQRLIALKTGDRSGEEKIQQLQTILKMPTHSKNIHLLGLLAQEYKKLEKWEEAEKTYREILKIKPNDLFQKKQIGFLYVKKGEPQKAIEFLEACLLADPDDHYVRNALFKAYRKVGAKAAALNLINKILNKHPDKKQYYGIRKRVEKWEE